jgi:hypothetical protein
LTYTHTIWRAYCCYSISTSFLIPGTAQSPCGKSVGLGARSLAESCFSQWPLPSWHTCPHRLPFLHCFAAMLIGLPLFTCSSQKPRNWHIPGRYPLR